MKRAHLCLLTGLIMLPMLAQALTLPALPQGMCALNEKQAAHAEVINFLRRANEGSNEVVASFADCNELAAIEAGKGKSIAHFGAVLQQSLGANLGLDRATYVQTAATVYASQGNALTNDALTGAREAVAGATKTGDVRNPTAITAQNKGILFQSKDMLIIGLTQNNMLGGKNIQVASTSAITLVRGAPISVNIYAPASADAFTRASASLKPFVGQLISTNP